MRFVEIFLRENAGPNGDEHTVSQWDISPSVAAILCRQLLTRGGGNSNGLDY